MNKQIIAYLGLQGAGKSTAAHREIKHKYLSKVMSFADSLREACWITLGFKPDNYDNFKKRLLFLHEFPDFVSHTLKFIFPFWLYGREYIQKIGTELFRNNVDKDYWIKKTINNIGALNLSVIAIDDVRYKSELMALYNFCKENGYEFKAIFCNYRSKRYNDNVKHSSEKLALWCRDELQLRHLQTINESVMNKISDEYGGE